ncbi:hypothetical protein O0L34_g8248 [Tuta absoluta]|nr:hypothetical protein O0L34_g8248 [Tuta absoluta]
MKVIIVLALCAFGVHGKVTPDDFPSCKRSDPNIDKCVVEAVEGLRPMLKDGIPELNIPALEPLSIPTLKIDRTAPNLRIKAVLKKMKAIGGGNFKVEKVRIHLNNKYAAEIKLSIPKLRVTADYDVRGSRILTLDITGKGKLKANFTDIKVLVKGSAKPIDKNGVEHLTLDKTVMKVRVGYGQVAFDETERPIAAASAAAFFNASPNTVMDVLSPIIEDTGAAVLKAFINKILDRIPLNEVLQE